MVQEHHDDYSSQTAIALIHDQAARLGRETLRRQLVQATLT
jgi:hypothetical protein